MATGATSATTGLAAAVTVDANSKHSAERTEQQQHVDATADEALKALRSEVAALRKEVAAHKKGGATNKEADDVKKDSQPSGFSSSLGKVLAAAAPTIIAGVAKVTTDAVFQEFNKQSQGNKVGAAVPPPAETPPNSSSTE